MSTLYPFQWLEVPELWPASVPPVIVIAHRLIRLNALIPSTVAWLIWLYYVHLGLLRVVQPPLDVRWMPTADSCAAACPSGILATASAGAAVRTSVATTKAV